MLSENVGKRVGECGGTGGEWFKRCVGENRVGGLFLRIVHVDKFGWGRKF